MTGKDLCELYVRYKHPEYNAAQVDHFAADLWSDAGDEPLHVMELMRMELIAGGVLPEDPEIADPVVGAVRICRNDGVAERFIWTGDRWICSAVSPPGRVPL